jgi:pimeloyl-ACP methyl ester carboxylesterase
VIALLPAVLTLAARLVAVPGLHVETTGTGPVVVLVHAFHMDLRQWDEQMPALAGYRVVRYDVRGHGKSGPPGEGYAPHEDLAALVRDLGVERVPIVGHSMGGQIAVDFALAHPELVDRLVLVSPGITGFNAPPAPRPAEMTVQIPAVKRLAELKARTLVIVGDRDEPPLLSLTQKIAAEAPNARRLEMKETAHMAPIERPAEFNGVLVDFLRAR